MRLESSSIEKGLECQAKGLYSVGKQEGFSKQQ